VCPDLIFLDSSTLAHVNYTPMIMRLSDLNPAQHDAATSTEGPLLVLAGAGSGKTRVLTHRIAHIVENGLASPHQILAITFTNKSASEMKHRLAQLCAAKSRAMWVMTFHAMCVRMLRAHSDLIGFDRSFTIYDADDSKRMIKEVMKSIGLDEKRYPVPGIASRVSLAKNELIGPAELASSAVTPIDKAAAKVFARYKRRMRDSNAMDFDDLLVETHTLLTSCPEALEAYQERFIYIMVDEYQDTNHAQYRIVNLLASKRRNLMVVGDDDQSIYSWRGADISNILEFEKDYPEAAVVRLEQNYRSSATILAAANAVVANNSGRKPKTLWTANAGGESITRYRAEDERDEGRFIASEIERLLRDENRGYSDFAIFYRTNAQSRVIEDALLRSGTPYQIVGGTKFFERAEIRDVMAYLKVMVNAADEISLKRIINKPRRGIGKTTVERLEAEAISRAEPFEAVLRRCAAGEYGSGPAAKVGPFVELLDELRASAAATLRDQIEAAIERTGLIGELQSENTFESSGRIENIREFLGVVDEYASARAFSEEEAPVGLPGFMEWLALRSDLDSVAEGSETVTLMTIHTAKGLEFPVVFIAGLEDSIFPHANSMFDSSGLEEERRLAYVAITRARERLYLTHARSRSLYGTTNYNAPSRFIAEIPQEHLSGGFVTPPKTAVRTPVAGAQYLTGEVVEHKVFGVGVIVDVAGEKVTVDFKGLGRKNLLKDFAPLRKVQTGGSD